jgi:hypothetical protein
LASLPVVQLNVTFQTTHGSFQGAFSGPLLWTVLSSMNATPAKSPRMLAGLTVWVTGHNGYTAAVSLAEIAPAFEGKQVILATSPDGKALGDGHLRLIIPVTVMVVGTSGM